MEERQERHKKNEKGESANYSQPAAAPPVNPVSVSAAPPSSDKFWKITTVVLIALLAIFLWRSGSLSGNSGSIGAAVANVPQPNAPAAPVDMKTLLDDDAVKGDPKAPVTIIEFSDYECPFCARFYSQTYLQIEEQYIKTGKVKLIYRDFPLSFHAQAQKAAEAAECAGEQGKYYEMHNKLFEEGVQGGVASFKQFAKDLSLSTTKFNDCLDKGKMAAEVQKDFLDGQRAGIQGTPGFFVNGQLISGAQPFSVFQQVIEAELAK